MHNYCYKRIRHQTKILKHTQPLTFIIPLFNEPGWANTNLGIVDQEFLTLL